MNNKLHTFTFQRRVKSRIIKKKKSHWLNLIIAVMWPDEIILIHGIISRDEIIWKPSLQPSLLTTTHARVYNNTIYVINNSRKRKYMYAYTKPEWKRGVCKFEFPNDTIDQVYDYSCTSPSMGCLSTTYPYLKFLPFMFSIVIM